MATTRFGQVQLKIMQVLWAKRRANAREITESLSRTEPIAHSTVQTLLRRLEAKGAVGHHVDDRTFVYYPLVEEQSARRGATRELVDRVFEGSAAGLIAHLLEHERISGEELRELRRLIGDKEEGEPQD